MVLFIYFINYSRSSIEYRIYLCTIFFFRFFRFFSTNWRSGIFDDHTVIVVIFLKSG